MERLEHSGRQLARSLEALFDTDPDLVTRWRHGIFQDVLAQALWDTCSDGYLISDEEGIILAANKGFCQLFGMREEDILGKMVWYPLNRAAGNTEDPVGESRFCVAKTDQDTTLLLEITRYSLELLIGRVSVSSFTVLSRSKISTAIVTEN